MTLDLDGRSVLREHLLGVAVRSLFDTPTKADVERVRVLFNTWARTGVIVITDPSDVFTVGDVTVDCGARSCHLDGEPVHLTRKEFDLLVALIRRAGTVVTPPRLLEEVWPESCPDGEFVGDRSTVAVYLSRLREKLGADRIATVRGIGFRYEADESTPGIVRERA